MKAKTRARGDARSIAGLEDFRVPQVMQEQCKEVAEAILILVAKDEEAFEIEAIETELV